MRNLFSYSLATFFLLTTAACSGNGGGDALTSDPDSGSAMDSGSSDAAAVPVATASAAVPLSACKNAKYTLAATIGTQTFDLALDTGSTSLGVASASCTDCSDAGVAPMYAPGPSAIDQGTQASSQFVYGNGWSGEIYQDDVALTPQTKVPVKLVAISTQDQFFDGTPCNSASGGLEGIVGFAPAGDEASGTNGYFDQFVATTNAPDMFAVELCGSKGMLWLGGYDSSFTTAAPVYTPMLPSFAPQAYAVNLASITIDGTTVPVGTPQYPAAIVDTGTPVFVLQQNAFDVVTQSIAKNAQFASLYGDASVFQGENCVVLTQTEEEIDAMFSPLTLTFGSSPAVTVQMPATQSYLQNPTFDQPSTWCTALSGAASSASFPASAILGVAALHSSVVIFDRQNQQIGFAPHTSCN